MGLRNLVAPEKKALAKKFRNNLTPAEARLASRLGNKQLGARFRVQSVMLGWIVDFYCPQHSLVVEVDGPIHRKHRERDQFRDNKLASKGFLTLRFTNDQVFNDLDGVVEQIRAATKNRRPVRVKDKAGAMQTWNPYLAYMERYKPLSSRLY